MDAYSALADKVRRSVLAELIAGPRRVVDLAATRPLSRPAVSKHLRLLLEAGLVEVTHRGRERHYRLAPGGLSEVHDFVSALRAARPAAVPDSTLAALEMEVRRTTRERRQRVPPRVEGDDEESA